MKINIARLGPGLMLAAAAVGVSHLVHATRAGAGFGLSLVWMVILISVLKYPAFRFAVDYASQTDRSLVHAYSRLGRIALAWLTIAMAVDFFVATTAVALVTAGLFISVFYVAPPLRLKHRGLGELGVLIVWAPLMIGGSYFVAAGTMP